MPKAYARIEHGKREWVATSAERMRNAAKDLTARADKLSKAAYSNPTASSHHAAEVAHRAAKDVHTKLVEKGLGDSDYACSAVSPRPDGRQPQDVCGHAVTAVDRVLELTKPYERVVHGRMEHVGGSQSRLKKLMSSGVFATGKAKFYENSTQKADFDRLTDKGQDAYNALRVLGMSHSTAHRRALRVHGRRLTRTERMMAQE